jgi:hypothetical protein
MFAVVGEASSVSVHPHQQQGVGLGGGDVTQLFELLESWIVHRMEHQISPLGDLLITEIHPEFGEVGIDVVEIVKTLTANTKFMLFDFVIVVHTTSILLSGHDTDPPNCEQ